MATQIRSSPVPVKTPIEDPMLSLFYEGKKKAFLTTKEQLKQGQSCLQESVVDFGFFQARIAQTLEGLTSEDQLLDPETLEGQKKILLGQYQEFAGLYVKVSVLGYHTLETINFLKPSYRPPSEESSFEEKLPDFYAQFIKQEKAYLKYVGKLEKLFTELVKGKSRFHELINGAQMLLSINALKREMTNQTSSLSFTERFMKRLTTPAIQEPLTEKPRVPLTKTSAAIATSSGIKSLSPAFAKQILTASQGRLSLSDDTSSPRISLSQSPRNPSPNVAKRRALPSSYAQALHPSDSPPGVRLSPSRYSTSRIVTSDYSPKTRYSPPSHKRSALSFIASDPSSTRVTPRSTRSSPRLYPYEHSSSNPCQLSRSSESITSSQRNPLFPSRSAPTARRNAAASRETSWESISLDKSSSTREPRRLSLANESDHSASRVSPRANPLLEKPSYAPKSRVSLDTSSGYRSTRETRERSSKTDPLLRRAEEVKRRETPTDRVPRSSSYTKSTPLPKVEVAARYTKAKEPERAAKRRSLTEILREKIIGKSYEQPLPPIQEKSPPRGRRRTYEQDLPPTHGKSSRY